MGPGASSTFHFPALIESVTGSGTEPFAGGGGVFAPATDQVFDEMNVNLPETVSELLFEARLFPIDANGNIIPDNAVSDRGVFTYK